MQGEPEEQLRALRTLANMSSSNSAVPVTTVQDGFRKLGAFAPLVKLMRDTLPDRPVRLAGSYKLIAQLCSVVLNTALL